MILGRGEQERRVGAFAECNRVEAASRGGKTVAAIKEQLSKEESRLVHVAQRGKQCFAGHL